MSAVMDQTSLGLSEVKLCSEEGGVFLYKYENRLKYRRIQITLCADTRYEHMQDVTQTQPERASVFEASLNNRQGFSVTEKTV